MSVFMVEFEVKTFKSDPFTTRRFFSTEEKAEACAREVETHHGVFNVFVSEEEVE